MRGVWKVLTVIGAVSLLLTGSTRAQTPAAPIKAGPPQTPVPVALPPRTPDPELDLPDTDTAKRIGGYADQEATGGADCRTSCDKSYYLCLANDGSGQCPASWTQCLTACPANSSNF